MPAPRRKPLLLRHLAVFAALTAIVFALRPSFVSEEAEQPLPAESVGYTEFMERVAQATSPEVIVDGSTATLADAKAEKRYETAIPGKAAAVERAEEAGAKVTVENASALWGMMAMLAPALLIVGVILFIHARQQKMMKGGGGGIGGIGKSQATRLTESHRKARFDEVAGVEEAKADLEEIVDYLRDPKRYTDLGGEIPKGVLLAGPPGTGKTLLARAVAGEADVPFYSVSGSAFIEMLVGVGAKRVRDTFQQARKNAPCIVFIDEFDALGRKRGAGMGGGNDEREQTLNQLLAEMDGFETGEGVILIGATNRPDVLDPALKRPGRFDREVTVEAPDIKGREAILQIHAKNVPLDDSVDLHEFARMTPGFTGADLHNLVNEAALAAARRRGKNVTREDLSAARERITLGSERRSLALTEEDKAVTAYHEAGHAIVARHREGNDPVEKVTIVPRGRAMGVTYMVPERDRYGYSRQQLTAKIAMAFGGRVAEQLTFGDQHVTSGAQQDIKMATAIARRMVTQYGMSDRVGLVDHSEGEGEVFLGEQLVRSKSISEATAREIDNEVKALIDEGYHEAKRILTDNAKELSHLAEALRAWETLDAQGIEAIIECSHQDQT